jgi:glycosyltransferase involved in cell wall biosynthesis
MHVTVILCTYNGARILPAALSSVAACVMPPSVDWEVLVVDNNSKDDTREVIQDFCRRFPARFRYMFEPKPGKSYALNSGIRNAHGDILAFMDDDVTVDPAWLANLTSSLHRSRWGGTGGKVVLQWPAQLPDWVTKDGPLARHGLPGFDKGEVAKDLDGPPFGTNMAFRREMFEKYGGFRTDLGPSPFNQIRAEDTEFGRRLLAEGVKLRYEPDAIVYHPVPEERIDKGYLVRWWFDNGRAHARHLQIEPLHLAASIVVWSLQWVFAFEPRLRFYRKLVVYEKVGELSEFCRCRLVSRKSENFRVAETKPERTA